MSAEHGKRRNRAPEYIVRNNQKERKQPLDTLHINGDQEKFRVNNSIVFLGRITGLYEDKHHKPYIMIERLTGNDSYHSQNVHSSPTMRAGMGLSKKERRLEWKPEGNSTVRVGELVVFQKDTTGKTFGENDLANFWMPLADYFLLLEEPEIKAKGVSLMPPLRRDAFGPYLAELEAFYEALAASEVEPATEE